MRLGVLVSIGAVMAFAGCSQQPIWKSEPPPPKPAAIPAEESTPMAEPEPPPVVERKAPVANPEPAPGSRRAPQVQAGITAYDNGNHREAEKLLRAALRTNLGTSDQVEARKYL